MHDSHQLLVLGFVFSDDGLVNAARGALKGAGIDASREEFKSSARMDSDRRMQHARKALLSLVDSSARVAIYVGRLDRRRVGFQSLQALQSILVRNSIDPRALTVYFDEGIFSSDREANRIFDLFHSLRGLELRPRTDSKRQVGIQLADLVASSFSQIIKEALDGSGKIVSIPDWGFSESASISLGWFLMMQLRHALFTRPVVYDGKEYDAASDPVILDPLDGDPVAAAQEPTLLGWGVQIAPDADPDLRQAVTETLRTVWLGCLH